MLSIILLAVGSFGLSAGLTPRVREFARRRRWFDHPDNERKIHTAPIPRIGGVPILLAFVGSFGLLHVHPIAFADSASLVWKLFPATVLVFATGLLDDLVGLTARQKLAGQTLAAILAWFGGIHIQHLAGYTLGSYASLPLTILWLVGCANAFNLIDGLDGLATGLGVVASLTMLTAGLLSNDASMVAALAALSGALLGFLIFNFSPASIFLGDCGSLSVGFLLGAFSVVWSQKAQSVPGLVAPLVALSIPLLDTALSIARRFLRRQPIFQGDREHIHHRLLDSGLPVWHVAVVFYALSGLGGCFALLQSRASTEVGWAMIVLNCAITWLGVSELRYREFDIAADFFRQNSIRSKVQTQLYLLHCEQLLATAASAEECWRAVRTMSHECGFSAAVLRLGPRRFHEQLMPTAAAHMLRIPLSDSDYVMFMWQFRSSRETSFIGAFADLLQQILSAKVVEFGPHQSTPKKRLAAAARQAMRV